MRFLLFYFILVLNIQVIFAQQSFLNPEPHKCSHQKRFFNKSFDKTHNQLLDNYDVKFYELNITAYDTSTYISGSTNIYSQVVNSTLDTFCIEFVTYMTIDSVLFDNTQTNYIHSDDLIKVPLAAPISVDEYFSVTVFYRGEPDSTSSFIAVYSAPDPDWGINATWTLSEPFSSKAWFPCKQVLEDRADSVFVSVTTDSTCKAGSNGVLTSIVDLSDGKTRYEWQHRHPITYYLISFAVADYMEYNLYAHPAEYPDSVLIQNYIYDTVECYDYYKFQIDYSTGLLETYSDLYVLYPYCDEKYGHCLTPLGGGMEHQTMTTLGYFDLGLTAHEFAHQWFGDYVTCATWSDIWINEGFASYSEYLAAQNLQTQWHADFWLDYSHMKAMEVEDGSIYVPVNETDNPARIFNYALSYKKGASIIHMIRYLVNDSLFFKTCEDFMTQYSDSVATGVDFKNVLENVSGMDFTDFFDQWYFGEGYPTYDVVWNQVNDTLTFTTIQTTSSVTPFFEMPMEYKLFYGNNDTVISFDQTSNTQTYNMFTTHAIDSIHVDPNNWILNKVGSITIGDIKELEVESYFSIYPNPATDKLILQFPDNDIKGDIIIYDITGKEIYSNSITCKNPVIPVDKFESGLYIIKAISSGSSYSRKFVKK